MVSVLAFFSNGPSTNPAEVYSFSVKFVFEKNENKQKEAGVGPFFNSGVFAENLRFFISLGQCGPIWQNFAFLAIF